MSKMPASRLVIALIGFITVSAVFATAEYMRLEANDPEPAIGTFMVEAESGTLSFPMIVVADAQTFGNLYVTSIFANSGTITFTVNIETAGDYVFWGRVLAPSSSQDSFFVSVDGGAEDIYDLAEGTWSTAWQWTKVNGRAGGAPLTLNPRIFSLSQGIHTIVFRTSDANSAIDCLVISNDPNFVPVDSQPLPTPTPTPIPTPSTYTVSATPDSVTVGSPITVNWSAPTGHSAVDWIGIYEVGAAESYIAWQYTGPTTSHTMIFIAPSRSTQYEFRYFLNSGFVHVATSNQVTVTDIEPTPTPTPTPDTMPPIISTVSSSGITPSGATICWTTNEASDTQVEYGTTAAYGSGTTLNTSMVTSHSQAVSGLSASTLHHYRVKARDAAGNLATSGDFTFTTSASSGSGTGCPGFVIEGFGRNTTGGCGGTIYTVTNLNDSGPGSLRDFLNRPGPRIIRFAVSGTITLQSDLEVTQPSLTIDGSTAPNGGICIKNARLVINSISNVIVRYIRIRPGGPGSRVDCIQMHNSSNIVIDHCSLSWGTDENLDLASQNVTIQWCIIAENMGTGALLMSYGTNPTTSAHHNLFANNRGSRLPEMGVGDLDYVNNVFYNYNNYGNTTFNPGCVAVDGTSCGRGGPIHANVVGNYYRAGAQSATPPAYSKEIRFLGRHPGFASQSAIYLQGNISPNRPNDTLPQDSIVWQDDGSLTIAGTRFNFPAVTTTSANQAYTDVLTNAGARLPCRDAVDQRIINDVINVTGSPITDPFQVAGYPDLNQACTSNPSP